MRISFNKWLILSIIWFVASLYALIWRESTGSHAPPFPHFDKLAHGLLFFAQAWLIAKIWLSEHRKLPILPIALFCLLEAIGTELAQHFFTLTRTGDVLDATADMLGTTIALYLTKISGSLKQK